jgi:hypothetical protein
LSSLSFPPARAVGRGAAWYRGDCHVHSVHSDGELNPEELAVQARAAGLDFIATTEHNSAAVPGAWGHLAADDFLIVLGEEVTTKTGHWLALGTDPGQVVDWNYQVRDGLIDSDRGKVHRASLPGDGPGVVQWDTTAEDSAFVRIEVRHPNGDVAALSNPIILT